MEKKYFLIVINALIIFSFNGCKKDSEIQTIEKTITGSAQKGPFLVGTSVSVYELFQNYSQTGRSFNTQITDNSGNFQLGNVSLISNYVQIRADGFYFNEVCGSNSIAPLTLNCIADIGSFGSLNLNVLTHLEKPRVEFLLSTGMPFDSAKVQAQRDVLNIFNISTTGMQYSEHLDISQAGEGNAILLAISSILQGFRTESELSTLLSVISNDILTDGILNNSNIQSSLIDHTLLLDTVSIRNNISNFYLNVGVNASIPHFETYIKQFITHSLFQITNSVNSYPETGFYGNNILLKSQLIYGASETSFSMTGQLKKCSRLTIRIHLISGDVWMLNDHTNFNVTNYDWNNNEQFFKVVDPNQPFDLRIYFSIGTYSVEYFEINSLVPSFSKTITVN